MKKHINEVYNQCEGFSYDDLMRLISELEDLCEVVWAKEDAQEAIEMRKSEREYQRSVLWY